MRPIHIVLAHRDPALGDSLARSIQKQFQNVETASDLDGIRRAIARRKCRLAVVDLELVTLADLGELCREFPATAFVCTHRLADDSMWSQSLALGAVDCCLASDVPKILQASAHYLAIKDSQASSAA